MSGLIKKISGYRCLSVTNVLNKKIYRYHKLLTNKVVKHPKYDFTLEDELFNLLDGKISFNSVVSMRNNRVRWAVRDELIKKQLSKNDAVPDVPFSLKYLHGDQMYEFAEFRDAYLTNEKDEEQITTDSVNFPYSSVRKVDFQSDTEDDVESKQDVIERFRRDIFTNMDVNSNQVDGRWFSDYEVYEEDTGNESEKIELSETIYGSHDPYVLPSNVPCSGCGAHLHCQNPSVPGFLPKELFLKSSENDLRASVCQRCTFLKHYNVALSLTVDPESYTKMLSKIKNKTALIIMMVDMTDFPCSIWPNVLDIVGTKAPILLVGNKIDLVPGDTPLWMNRAEKVLREAFPRSANILGVKLISAKTGFGVEDLISLIHNKWSTKGDTYLVGCTNVGKSSLFNALIHSDFCRSDAVDLMKRATISPWPGTTLNLLKFPILRLSTWRAALRINRLKKESQLLANERKIERLQAKQSHLKLSNLPKIIGSISRTFRTKYVSLHDQQQLGQFSAPKITMNLLKQDDRIFLDPEDEKFKHCNWCYDTPGVVHKDQIIDLLTTEELNTLQSEHVWSARFFMLQPENSLFIAGIARIDLLDYPAPFVRLILYSCQKLPVTICKTEFADQVYNTLIGTKYFRIPRGSEERLEKWPALKSTQEYEITGYGHARCTSEIVLSSAGWISFSARNQAVFHVRPWTPEGRGIYFRSNPLLINTPLQRKSKVAFTPTYYTRTP